jgi:uncharacterized membrane protein YkvA (DUF1232 family)
MLARLSAWAKAVKAELLTLWFATKHPQAPLAAKVIAVIVVAYAFSPIDLIPDFIPVLGYLDDLLIVPLGIWLAFRLMPEAVRIEARAKAEQWIAERRDRPRNYLAAALIVAVWIALGVWLARLFEFPYK